MLLCLFSFWNESWTPTRESRRLRAQLLQLSRKKLALSLCRTSVLFSKPLFMLLANTRYYGVHFIFFIYRVCCRYFIWVQDQLRHALQTFYFYIIRCVSQWMASVVFDIMHFWSISNDDDDDEKYYQIEDDSDIRLGTETSNSTPSVI